MEFAPADLGIDQPMRAPQVPAGLAHEAGEGDEGDSARDTAALASAAAEAGLAALAGQHGPTRDSLVLGAALCLWHLKRHGSLESAAQAVRAALDSGKASARVRH